MRTLFGTLTIISMLSIASLGMAQNARTPGANCSLPNIATGKVYYSIMYAGSYVRSKQVAFQNVMNQCRTEAGDAADQVCVPENVSCSIAERI